MKKAVVIAVALSLLLALVGSVATAKSPDHKIVRKFDLNGYFVAHPGYNWGGLKEGATWHYSIHIKEALNGEYSVGSIHFDSGDVSVTGRVEATKSPYDYWSGDKVLAARGTANYEGTRYNFMFLFSERAIWFAISEEPFGTLWDSESIWPGGQRDYQLHSKVPDETFPWNPKEIH